MESNNQLIEEFEQFKNLMPENSPQRHYYEILLERAKPVEVVSLREVFTEEEISKIRDAVKPKEKECYKNAMRFITLFPDRAEYVEGKLLAGGIFGTEHAFNRIGDKYVDITIELALGKDVTKEQYIILTEYNRQDIYDLILKHEYYTFFTEELILKQLANK